MAHLLDLHHQMNLVRELQRDQLALVQQVVLVRVLGQVLWVILAQLLVELCRYLSPLGRRLLVQQRLVLGFGALQQALVLQLGVSLLQHQRLLMRMVRVQKRKVQARLAPVLALKKRVRVLMVELLVG